MFESLSFCRGRGRGWRTLSYFTEVQLCLVIGCGNEYHLFLLRHVPFRYWLCGWLDSYLTGEKDFSRLTKRDGGCS